MRDVDRDRFATAARVLSAETPSNEEVRLSFHSWVSSALFVLGSELPPEQLEPGLALLNALEALGHGMILPGLRRPPQMRGRKGEPAHSPALSALRAFSVVCVDILMIEQRIGVEVAISEIAEQSGLNPGAIRSLRKRLKSAYAAPTSMKSTGLLEDYRCFRDELDSASSSDRQGSIMRLRQMAAVCRGSLKR